MSEFSGVRFESSLKQVRDWLWMFPANRSGKRTFSWWLNTFPEPVLIDCPELSEEVISDLQTLAKGSNPRILLTNRDAHGDVNLLNKKFGWPVVVQEQESYLLPAIDDLETFSDELIISSGLRLFWTPGPSPGSAVVYAPEPFNVLFCGRLLTPVAKDQIAPVRTRNTFHWTMQKQSLNKLCLWLPSKSNPSLASGERLELIGDDKLLGWSAWQQGKVD